MGDGVVFVGESGAKGMMCNKAYQGVKQGEDSDDEDDAFRTKHKHKKKGKIVLAHDVGPSRREQARWGADLHNNLEQNQNKRRVVAVSESESENMANAIFDVFRYGDTIKRDRFKDLVIALSRGEAVEEIEVDWVMSMVDKNRTGEINKSQLSEVKTAVAKWIMTRKPVQKAFEKYDKDHSGILSREEVRHMLTDLNDGIRVSDQELSLVLRNSSKFRTGSIVVPEFQEAVNFWYNNVHPPQPTDLANKKDPGKGGAVGRANSSMINAKINAKLLGGSAARDKFAGAAQAAVLTENGFPAAKRCGNEDHRSHRHPAAEANAKDRKQWEEHYGSNSASDGASRHHARHGSLSVTTGAPLTGAPFSPASASISPASASSNDSGNSRHHARHGSLPPTPGPKGL